MQKLLLQFIYSFLIRWFLKIVVGVRVNETDFLEEEEQFIIVANHNSHLDTMSLMASVPSNKVHQLRPVAAADHFGKTKLKAKLSNFFVNTLLIQRKRDKENPENDPIHKMIKALDEGYSLIIFPEGTRGEPEKDQPLKMGVALVLAQRPHIKYIPAYMKGMGKAMPKGDSLIIPFNSTLNFGKATAIRSQEAAEILKQIEGDFKTLKAI